MNTGANISGIYRFSKITRFKGGIFVRKRSKKTVMLLTILIVATFSLGGCGVTDTSSSTPGSVSQINQISDEPASNESTVSNSKSVTFPADFPADFPMYNDATFGEISRQEGKDYPTSTIFYFFFSGNTDKIISWYNSELASKGWTITESSNNNLDSLYAQIGDPVKGNTTMTAIIAETGSNEKGRDIAIMLTLQYW